MPLTLIFSFKGGTLEIVEVLLAKLTKLTKAQSMLLKRSVWARRPVIVLRPIRSEPLPLM